ncbi:hypothetical protein C8T65DRAFT_639510 [Cerioporus squamosus]|nr:hypothetical protein C8T65DRAFT_639510 [Cerioporus squamosus]
MNRENLVFRVPDLGLFVAATYYTPTQTERSDSERVDGDSEVTLVFAHSSSGHWAQREDTIARLLRVGATSKQSPQRWRVRDACALDAHSYGDSPSLDENTLADRKPLSVVEYATVLRYFVTSKFVQGRSIIAIGQAESTSAWTLACAGATLPNICAMIFIQPEMASPPVSQEDEPITQDIVNVFGVLMKPDLSGSLAVVQKSLQMRHPWKVWDERVFEAHLRHGFVEFRDAATELVEIPTTTTCSPALDEETGFHVADGRVVAGRLASDVCSRYPVHVVLGQRPEAGANEVVKSICVASDGTPVACSVSIAPRSGRLSVQENPEAIFHAISRIIELSLRVKVTAGKLAARL